MSETAAPPPVPPGGEHAGPYPAGGAPARPPGDRRPAAGGDRPRTRAGERASDGPAEGAEGRAGAASKPLVGAEAFGALDLRVARVVEVLPFPEARRPAWRMVLDGGPALGRLQSSAQLTRYTRDDLLGRLVVVAVNLGPRSIAGWRSDVLVLAAVPADGPRLLGVDAEVPPGTPVA